MSDSDKKAPKQKPEDLTRMDQAKKRRAALKKLGRFATVTAPTVTLLLAAQTKPGKAAPPSSCKPSSRALKTVEGKVGAASVLAGVAALSAGAWRRRAETGPGQQAHIDLRAQDFRAAFGVGDGVAIASIDAIGVCLAAIKALSEKVDILESGLRAAQRTATA